MTFAKKKKNNKIFDIVVVGAGPAGIAFACGFAETNVKIAIVDKLPREVIANPKVDGREIALTHHSVKVLKKLNVWNYISNKSISVIKEARIMDGNSTYFLNFNHKEIKITPDIVLDSWDEAIKFMEEPRYNWNMPMYYYTNKI